MVKGDGMLAEGAEARIYEASVAGMPCILKHRMAKGYRIRELDERLRFQRTRSEARIMRAASESGIGSPTVLLLGKDKIFMSRIEGRNLNGILEAEGDTPASRGYSAMAGRQLSVLHSMGISHGDFTPANIMVDGAGRTHIIDFGLSETGNSTESKALDILLIKRSLQRGLYAEFIKGYSSRYGDAAKVIRRCAEIERRGRYQSRTLA